MSMLPVPNHCLICNHLFMGSGPMDECPNCHPDTTLIFSREDREEPRAEEFRDGTGRFRNIVAGLVVKGDRVLLSQRNDYQSQIFKRWESSGGSVEAGETLREALVREYKEETLMDIQIIDWIATVMVHKPTSPLIISHYLCTSNDEPQETDECINPTWYSPNELIDDKLVVMPGMKAVRALLYKAALDYIVEHS